MTTTATTLETTTEKINEHRSGLVRTNVVRLAALIIALVLLAAVTVLSLGLGARAISPGMIWESLWSYDPNNIEHLAIRELRIPRTVVGLIVGPALGLCGALLPALTRNPLADPGILGVNAGASFAVTAAVGILGLTAPLAYVWFALLGSAAVTVLVYILGSIGGRRATPAKLVLAGVAIGAVLGGV